MSSNSPQQADQPTPERIDLIAKLRAEAESLPDAYVDAFKAEQVSDLLREAASALASPPTAPEGDWTALQSLLHRVKRLRQIRYNAPVKGGEFEKLIPPATLEEVIVALEAYSLLLASAPPPPQPELLSVQKIECVSYDSGFEQPAEPVWRMQLGEYCADFETPTAAENWRRAIMDFARLGPPPQARPDSPSRDHDHAVSALGWRTEPVAWRVKDFADGWIICHTESYAKHLAEGAGNLIQPLYPPPPSENDLSGRTAKPTDPLTVQAEISSSPQADTAGLVEALAEFIRIDGFISMHEMFAKDWEPAVARARQALALHRAASQGVGG